MVLAEVTVYTPFILRPLLAAFSLVDRGQIEAASVLGARPFRIAWRAILEQRVPYYRLLPRDLQGQLEQHMHVILAEKSFIG